MTAPKEHFSLIDSGIDSDIDSGIDSGALAEIGGMLDDGLLVVDDAGTVMSANNAAVRFLGEGLVGRDLVDLIPAKDISDVVAGRGRERFQPSHAFRKAFDTHLLVAGVPEAHIRYLLGRRSGIDGYTPWRLLEDRLRRAVAPIPPPAAINFYRVQSRI